MLRALESLGVELCPVNTQPSGLVGAALLNGTALTRAGRRGVARPFEALRQARREARVSPASVGLRRVVARRRLGHLGPLDAVLQVHAEVALDSNIPFATYEDLTIVQALRHGYREWTHLSRSEQQRRVAQQGAVYRRASACCTTSRWIRDSVVGDYGIAPERVHVVGIGGEVADPRGERDWTTPRFLFVGMDWRRKNGDAVIRAFARLRCSHPTAELHLVGGHPRVGAPGVVGHGPLRLGWPFEREQVRELFRRSTCFVLPSWVEPTAIAYVEAASFGLPSIATSVGGSADLVGDGGVLVDPGNEDALVRAMVELCDPGRAHALGALGRARSGLFTWPRVAARILTALKLPGFDEPPLY